MNHAYRLRCTECGASYDDRDVCYVCVSCAAAQQPAGITRGILEVAWTQDALRARYALWKQQGARVGIERHRSLLPIDDASPVLHLPVGQTPILPVPRLRDRLNMPRLFVKDDTRNPSASYKDRASALVCIKAWEYKQTTIVAASTGNAATALSCIAASMGQKAIILVPRSAPSGKLVQMLSYGAMVVPVDGTYDQAFELSLMATKQFGWYNRNTAFNPFTIEGKKTASLELLEDLGGEAPDVVIVPTGDGVIISGIAKGFRDLRDAGAIARVPRLLAVQAAGSCSIAKALQQGTSEPLVQAGASTVADSICVAAPRAGLLAVRAVRESGGTGVIVQDDAILEAIGELARYGAVFAEPAAAASLAGLHAALAQQLVDKKERTVLLVTGHGLKDVASASKVVRMPEAIAPRLEPLLERLKETASTEMIAGKA